MMRAWIVFFFINFSVAGAVWGQQVVIKNSGTSNQPVIAVKWYSNAIYYPDGINIYRHKVGQQGWEKLNETPLMMMDTVFAEAYERDSTLQPVVEMVKQVPKKDIIKNGFLKLTVLLKSFQSNIFSKFLGIYYEDSTVEMGSIYRYRINRVVRGRELLIGESRPLQAGDPFVFDPPADFEVTQVGQQVAFHWKMEEYRFYGVNIYRSTDGLSFEKLNQLPVMVSQVYNKSGELSYPEVLYADKQVEVGSKYFYKIEGLNFFGDRSTLSGIDSVVIKDMTPPPAPKHPENKEVKELNVTLSWKTVRSEKVHGYNIYRSKNSQGPFHLASVYTVDIEENTYTDTVPFPGNYYYFVASLGTNGVEAPSNHMHVEVPDVFPPETPKNVTIKADTGKVHLQWEVNAEQDLKGYWIYRSILNDRKQHFVLLNTNPQSQNRFEDQLPENAKNKFIYKVVAVDTSFNISAPSEIVSAHLPDITPPQKPFLQTVGVVDDKHVKVRWKPNADQDIKSYQIYRSDTSRNYHQVASVGLSRHEYVDRKVNMGNTYYYRVYASDSAGNVSEPSNSMIVTVEKKNDLKIRTPEKLSLKQLNKSSVKVSWSLNTSADNLLGVVVYRRKASGAMMPVSSKLNANSFVDDNVLPDMKYTYQVRAYYEGGHIAPSALTVIAVE